MEWPRDIALKIWWTARRTEAAERIQAAVRGYQVRVWLEHPYARMLDALHPRFNEDTLVGAVACLIALTGPSGRYVCGRSKEYYTFNFPLVIRSPRHLALELVPVHSARGDCRFCRGRGSCPAAD